MDFGACLALRHRSKFFKLWSKELVYRVRFLEAPNCKKSLDIGVRFLLNSLSHGSNLDFSARKKIRTVRFCLRFLEICVYSEFQAVSIDIGIREKLSS